MGVQVVVKRQIIVAAVVLAFVAGCGSETSPRALPVLEAGDRADASTRMAAPEMVSDMPAWGGTEYEVDGDLPQLDDSARAWELALAKPDQDRIRELADVLGVEGEVERTEFGWSIVGEDGARLDVQRQAGLPWNRSGSSADDVVSSEPVTCSPDGSCEEPEPPKRPADLPSKAEAEKLGRELLERLGVDLDDAKVEVQDGFSSWNVLADPSVDGLPVIGMTTSVAIGPRGEVDYANGWLGEPEKGDEYPLIGTKAALKKLKDQEVRILDAGRPESSSMIACDPAADCVPPGPVEPTIVHITDVRLGLQLFSSWKLDEPAYLVPTYLFETKDEGELPVIAIEDEFLTPQPEPEPAVEPGGGSGSASCSGSGSSSASGADDGSIELCGSDAVAVGEPAMWSVKTTCPTKEMAVDFGDGTKETLPVGDVTHRYGQAGEYDVRFSPTNCATSIGMTITVGDVPTVTTMIAPTEPTEPAEPADRR